MVGIWNFFFLQELILGIFVKFKGPKDVFGILVAIMIL